MEEALRAAVGVVILAAEVLGAIVVATALALGVAPYLRALLPRGAMPTTRQVRQRVGRGLVLGLEFLIAADLLRTIQRPTLVLQEAVVLAIIVAVRTVLSLSLEHELRQLGSEDGAPPEARRERT